MSASARQTIAFITGFLAIGYILNFIWEYLQCVPFFLHGEGSPTIAAMFLASLGDILMMCLVYLVVTIFKKSLDCFLLDWNFKMLLLIAISSITIAVLVEVIAMKASRWSYTDRNPIIPWLGVSILPVLQMLFINLLTFYISKRIVSHSFEVSI